MQNSNEIRITYRHCNLEIHQVNGGFNINALSNDEDFWGGWRETLDEAMDAIKAEIDSEYDDTPAVLEPRAVAFETSHEVWEPWMDESYG
jgi:hypothetical protein